MLARIGSDVGVQELLEYGVDPDYPTGDGLDTPLIAAVMGFQSRILQILIAAGADVNYQNGNGHSALHVAGTFGTKDIIRTLLANGADPQIIDHEGKTPIDIASKFGHAEAVDDLLQVDKSKLGTMELTPPSLFVQTHLHPDPDSILARELTTVDAESTKSSATPFNNTSMIHRGTIMFIDPSEDHGGVGRVSYIQWAAYMCRM